MSRVRRRRYVRWGIVFSEETRFVVGREEENGGCGKEGEVGGHGA